VFVENDARLGVAQQPRQRGLAVKEWEIAKILAIVLDQIEGIDARAMRSLPSVDSLVSVAKGKIVR